MCGNSSVGRAQPCQGWGREFESRFPLIKHRHSFFHSILCIRGREISDTFFCPPHSAATGSPPLSVLFQPPSAAAQTLLAAAQSLAAAAQTVPLSESGVRGKQNGAQGKRKNLLFYFVLWQDICNFATDEVLEPAGAKRLRGRAHTITQPWETVKTPSFPKSRIPSSEKAKHHHSKK